MKPNHKRRPKKLAARAAALKQHRKTAEIGIDPKYWHGPYEKHFLSPGWKERSKAWDIANVA